MALDQLNKMKHIFILTCLLSSPFFAWSQFGGGVSDGAQDLAIPETRIDGVFTKIPFTGSSGDGAGDAYAMLNLGTVDMSILFIGGSGDGFSLKKEILLLGLENYNVLFGGGVGDGHHEALAQTFIDGTQTYPMYTGGIADGAGYQHKEVQFGLSSIDYFGGGVGDGATHEYLADALSVKMTQLYAGGVGDGHDVHMAYDLKFPATICVGNRLYVDIDAQGSGTGLSWQHAINSLSLAFENSKLCPVTDIWVAEGEYTPTSTSDRMISFYPPSDMNILGGFSGNEWADTQRDWDLNETILSGAIGTPSMNDNSYQVVDFSQTNGTSTLDGFIIEKGNADDLVNGESSGAGIINSNPANQQNHFIRNSWIRNCSSVALGPAYYAKGSNSNLQLQNVSISDMNGPGSNLIKIEDGATLRVEDRVTIKE